MVDELEHKYDRNARTRRTSENSDSVKAILKEGGMMDRKVNSS